MYEGTNYEEMKNGRFTLFPDTPENRDAFLWATKVAHNFVLNRLELDREGSLEQTILEISSFYDFLAEGVVG